MLRIENLTFSYGMVTVYHKAQFIAHQNEITVISGPSGSGKSTLLDIISYRYPTAGHYNYNDNEINENNYQSLLDKICYVSQEPIFPENLKIKDQWELLRKIYSNTINIDQYIKVLKLDQVLELYPKQLSGGEKLRVSLINAILCNKEILLLDEPTAALNDELSNQLIDLLNEYKPNHYIIVASHDKRLFDSSDCLYEIDNEKLIIKKQKAHHENNIIKSSPYQKTITWFKPFIKIKRHHLAKTLIKYLLSSFAVAICSFFLWMNVDFIDQYANQLSKLESDEVLLYKSIDKKIPGYDITSNFPITEAELEVINQVSHIESLIPKIVMQTYDSNINDLDFTNPQLDIIKNKQKVYCLQEDESNDFIYFESFNQNSKKNQDYLTYLSDNHEGIYISASFVNDNNLSEKDLSDASVTVEMGLPTYDVSGLNAVSYAYTMDNNYNMAIPCNSVLIQKEVITLPIVGIYQVGIDNLVAGDANTFLISDSLMIKLCNQTRAHDPFVSYYGSGGLQTTIDNAIETLIYTPWQPNAYVVKVDDLNNVAKVVADLKSHGFTVDWKYSDYDLFSQSLIETGSFLKSFGIILLIFVTATIIIINYIKNKNEYLFNRWLNQIGYYNIYDVIKIKIQSYILDVFVCFGLSVVLTMFICSIVSESKGNTYPFTIAMFLTIIVLVLFIQLVVPFIYEVFDYVTNE